MIEFLIYDLKVAVLIAVFYMFYRLLLSRDTLHRMNRVVLLTTAVASFVLPLCVVTIHHTVVVPQATGNVSADLPMMAVVEKSLPWWQQAVVAVFFLGVAVTLGHLLWSVGQVVHLVRHSEKHPQADGTIVCVVDAIPPLFGHFFSAEKGSVSPFSWMRYIVLSRQDYESPDPAIMAHERGHIRQRHSADVLLVDTLTVLQWFNPAMWMLRQDLRAIHEYEADAAVLSQGINMRQYQYLLIQKAVVTCGYSVANGITHSTLKNRITMMQNKKKSTRKSMFKLLALLPIVGVALALNAETVTDYVTQQPQKQVVKKGKKVGQIKMGSKTIEVKTDDGTYTAENVKLDLNANEQDSTQSPLVIFVGKKDGHEPLIIINGKVSTEEQMKALDPKDIDHIDVLKDESSVAQFGEKGKNGVIIITTKTAPVMYLGEAKVFPSVIDLTDEDAVDTGSEKVFDVVEQMPEFPGGVEAMMKFLQENVSYPEAAYKAGVQGRVIVQFIVDTEGRVTNTKIVKKVSDELDAEAIRVVGTMPRWKPGMQNGEPVRVMYTMPITFRLN